MPQATSPDSYADARALMDRALDSPRGLRIKVHANEAWRLRMNCYTVRARDRTLMAKIHPHDHPQHGRSAYDTLTFVFEDANGRRTSNLPDIAALIISHGEMIHFDIEELQP